MLPTKISLVVIAVMETKNDNEKREPSMMDILNCLQDFKNEIKNATDDMKNTSEENRKSLAETKVNIENLDNKMEAIKIDIEDKDKRTENKLIAMEERLLLIEEGARRSEVLRNKTKKLREIERNLDNQPSGRIGLKDQHKDEQRAVENRLTIYPILHLPFNPLGQRSWS